MSSAPIKTRSDTRSTTRSLRPLTSRSKVQTTSSEDLATTLETKLTISDAKGKSKAKTTQPTVEERRINAMRDINATSRSLSAVLDSASQRTSSVKYDDTSIFESVSTAKSALQMLRKLNPGEMDIERAASSIVGKLVSLEMDDAALQIISDMHPALIAIYNVDHCPLRQPPHTFRFLCLPVFAGVLSDAVLALIATYLLHVIIIHSRISTDSVDFVSALYDTPTLLTWVPRLGSLPPKQHDSILTRAYTAVARCASSPGVSAVVAFRLRTYGLLCLAQTRPSVIVPNTFWDQAVKFAAAFAGEIEAEQKKAAVVEQLLKTYDELVACAQRRKDKDDFMSGPGFIEFCEHWIGFARQGNNLQSLSSITRLMRSIGEDTTNRHGEQECVREHTALKAATICATLAQTVAVFDQWADHTDNRALRIHDAAMSIKNCQQFLIEVNEGDDRRTADKVRRALERLRRSAVKVLELSSSDGASSKSGQVRQSAEVILKEIVDVLATTVKERTTVAQGTLTPALDSLFVLARNSLVVSNPDTYSCAYELLSHASSLVVGLSPTDADAVASYANYVRCVSGAFHNLAGILYQAGRFSHAVPFLKEGCALGNRALEIYRNGGKRKTDEEKKDAWKQLEEQLYRRWEILAVCQYKTGDRKLEYEAYLECMRAFPFCQASFMQLTRTSSLAHAFEASSTLRQMGNIVDRVTYMGVCDLFRDSAELSAKTWLEGVAMMNDSADCMESTQTWKCVVGALLEKQAVGLEGSRWKPGVRKVMQTLLSHALDIYSASERPIRRARVLLTCLELAYYTPTGASDSLCRITEIGGEVRALLLVENVGYDAELVQFRTQYLATLNLWLALHTHRRGNTHEFSSIVTGVEEACKILKSLLPSVPRQSLVKTKSPRDATTVKRSAIKGGVGTTRTMLPRSRAKKAVNADPPVTPKARKVLNDVSLNTVTAPLNSSALPSKSFTLDHFKKLMNLVQMASELLGLMGYVLAKIHLLSVAWKLSEHQEGPASEEYIIMSVDLAHEYVKLGRAEKAASIYSQALTAIRNVGTTTEIRTLFLLRYAESLAASGNVLKGSSIYCEALALSDALSSDTKGLSTSQRVKLRVAVLQRAAIAATTFSAIQYCKDDPAMSFNGLLQALRLWNRAIETLARLSSSSSKSSGEEINPFEVTHSEDAQSNPGNRCTLSEQVAPSRALSLKSSMDGMEWRIAAGALETLLALSQAYFARGSPREAEYFAQQAHDLAKCLHAPAMISRALAQDGEILLHLGRLDEGYDALVQAASLIADVLGPDAVNIRRLHGHYSQLRARHGDAQRLFEEAMNMLDELSQAFAAFDGATIGTRKSLGMSPRGPTVRRANDALVPTLLAAVLRQHIWLLRDTGEEYKTLLERFSTLPPTVETKAEESALIAKLTLDDVYSRFRADMFLSSLAESAITIPVGMSSSRTTSISSAAQDILHTLTAVEKSLWADLSLIAHRGNVPHVRDTATSLALIRALQTSLGSGGEEASGIAAHLIDVSSAITLHREMLEAIQHKFIDPVSFNDMRWPSMTPNGSPLAPRTQTHSRFEPAGDSDEEVDDVCHSSSLKDYWNLVQKKYRSRVFDPTAMLNDQEYDLPSHWTVVNISVTEDKNLMFITRQRAQRKPLVFCLPLKGRRDNEDEDYLGFNDAISELKTIIQLNDEGTKQAANVRKDDKAARAAWWADRTALDRRLKELLENIEFCWLGAFKTILSQPVNHSLDELATLRSRLDKVFEGSLVLKDKKQTVRVKLEDTLLECISSLPLNCRDEELEDLIYFILDLYQFHGIPVAIAEVDIDQVVVDLRSTLAEHAAKTKGRTAPDDDCHMFLVLDKNVQGIPWESLPTLRGKSVSRIPSMNFLMDRIQSFYCKSGSVEKVFLDSSKAQHDRASVDPRKTFYILNPSGDLKGTEGRFASWLKDMRPAGWDGLIGRVPSEQQFINALTRNDLVM
ncbi:hypothetical protein AcV5_002308 [Taiwanofungus camphoratus]|nr:hypothetical protein AcV5_002308 [Antrodia cinnamomea]KAI0941841.1 hypothetical protein AcV7_002414 [Antrodia cinnamomea]